MATTIEPLTFQRPDHMISPRIMKSMSETFSVSNAEASLRFLVSSDGIDIKLINSAPIFAIRFEVRFADKFAYRTPDLSDRVRNLNNYINFQDNTLTFVLLDMGGKGIQAGDDTIVRIPSEANQNFEVASSYASFGNFGIVEIAHSTSNGLSEENALVLEQNEPNPFSGSTRIEFKLPERTSVRLVVYDVAGALIQTLLDATVGGGVHSVEWDGRDDNGKPVDLGVYFYKLYAGINSVTQKMVFLK